MSELPPQELPVTEEHVLCVPKATITAQFGTWDGLLPGISVNPLLTSGSAVFLPRSIAENDPTHKQIIPYHVLVYRPPDKDKETCVFTFSRSKRGGETRLHDKLSIGVGGHVNDRDSKDPLTAFHTGALRELYEEVQMAAGTVGCEDFGLLDYNEDAVGQVHLGVVKLWYLPYPCVWPNDPELGSCGFLRLSSLAAKADQLETWSRFVLPSLTP